MKTILRIFFKTLLFTLLGWSVAFAQTIRIADNNTNRPTGANIFSTIQAAVNAAVPGDIVYITPSLTNYGDVTISKRITLTGVGFNTPELGGRYSGVNNITLLSSADGVNSTSGSKFTKFYFNDLFFAAGGVGTLPYNNINIDNVAGHYITYTGSPNTVNDIIIHDCSLAGVFMPQTNTNTRIYHNRIEFTNSYNDGIYLNNTTNALITNNLFYKTNNYGSIAFIDLTNALNCRIEHNLFSGVGSAFRNLINTPVVNNIFYGINPNTVNTTTLFRDNVFSNNLVTPAAAIPPVANSGGSNSGQDNLTNLSPGFVNGPASATTWLEAYDYSFPISSPCYHTGTTGEDIGVTGGLYPLDKNLKLTPAAIPLITLFNNPGVVPQNQPLKSNIKAKSN